MKQTDDFIESLKDTFNQLIYRGPSEEIPSAIFDAIQIIYRNYPMKPFIFRKRLIVKPSQIEEYRTKVLEGDDDLPKSKPEKTPRQKISFPKHLSPEEIITFIRHRPKKKQTWFLVIHLPPGCDYFEFKARESTFATAVGGTCQIEKVGKAAYMTISNILLPRKYLYEFDPRPYLKKMAIPIYLGQTVNGPIVEDFTKMVSIFVAGLRDTGKTVLTHAAIYTCLNINKIMGGNYITVAIIDPKLKELRYFEDYGATWTHESEESYQLLKLIKDANRQRKNIIGTKANNILEYNSVAKEPLPYIMLFIDEVDMVGTDKDCAAILIESVKKYRSQGIYVWASTQRPSADSWGKGNSFSEFKSQFEARMVYRMADGINSRMVLESDKSAHLPKIPGRAIYKYDVESEVQTPYFPSLISDPNAFHFLMDQLPKVALPYENVEGEVHDYDPLYPCLRSQARSSSAGTSRTLQLLKSGTNPFT